mmetsp:Transcript_15808/g.18349  ORF Transcript_15808/g.18349 Transcript_15808/m.18349 type:complete len:97 (-) Transcript_15808:451-741(-)
MATKNMRMARAKKRINERKKAIPDTPGRAFDAVVERTEAHTLAIKRIGALYLFFTTPVFCFSFTQTRTKHPLITDAASRIDDHINAEGCVMSSITF